MLFRLLVASLFVFASAQAAADAVPTRQEAARFLVQASFGPTEREIAAVQALGYEGWILEQFATPGQSARARIDAHRASEARTRRYTFRDYFWEQALYAPDQLRTRMTFALSQIVVISADGTQMFEAETFANYVDMLRTASFGSYGTLIHDVTFSPLMADYLTYFKNMKADPRTGRAPDENYAREVMQLFTIGLEELNLDGTSKGVETYTSEDVEGLAAVFTGFASPFKLFGRSRLNDNNADAPLKGYPAFHEPGPKTFLGTTIPGNLPPEESVRRALDHLLKHPNVAPFISKQLIQKFITSNPSPAYVERIARVFNNGQYTLPSGTPVGSGDRGDLKPVIAAILLDPEARDGARADDPDFGKVREPVLRLAHTLRVLSDPDAEASTTGALPNVKTLRKPDAMHNQLVFSPPSVFGFYRPGYVAAGTEAARQGMVAPEMQLMTNDHIISQARYLTNVMRENPPEFFLRDDARLFRAAERPRVLVAELEAMLTYGRLGPSVRRQIERAVAEIDVSASGKRRTKDLYRRLMIATMMLTTTPEFMVQR
ncbi:MAG: DUF1800 domain-containing protein [Pseudomonadota bacterium]